MRQKTSRPDSQTMNGRFYTQTLLFCDSDLDGTVGRLCFQYFCMPCEIIQTHAAEVDEVVRSSSLVGYGSIGFVDLCVTPEHWSDLRDRQNKSRLWLWDHHPRAPEILQSPDVFWSAEHCSAMLVYNWMADDTNPVLRRLVELTQVYDTWQSGSPDFRAALDLNNILYFYTDRNPDGLNRFVETQLEKVRFQDEWYFTDAEDYIIHNARQKENQSFKRVKRTAVMKEDRSGRPYVYIEAERAQASLMAYLIQQEFLEADYACVKLMLNNDRNQFSLRTSRPDVAVNTIARQYGGGGHRAAAGFLLTDEDYIAYLSGRAKL